MIPKTNRISWIDCVRGYCILAVIIGHTIPQSVVTRYIYMFHIPMFFLLSGYLYNEKSVHNFKKNTKHLLIPYMIACFFTTFIYYFFINGSSIKETLYLFYTSMKTGWGGVIGFLWFLPVLYACKLISIALLSITNKLSHKWQNPFLIVIVIILSVIGYLPSLKYPTFNSMFYLHFDIVLYSLLYYIAGYYIKKYNILELLNNKILRCCLSMLAILSLFYLDNFNLITRTYPLGWFTFIVSIIFCILIMFFFQSITSIHFLEVIGKNTMSILIIHNIERFCIYDSFLVMNFPWYINLLFRLFYITLFFLIYYKLKQNVSSIKNKKINYNTTI